MNFNFGDVLSRAGQITWKYKTLWISGIVISILGLLSLPISLLFSDPMSFMTTDPAELNQKMGSIWLANGLIFLLSIASIPVFIIGMSVPSLATRRAEHGEGSLAFGDLVRDSLSYFWRVLGIYLLVYVGIFVFMMAFMACLAALSIATMGFGFLCAFPLLFLFIPIGILVFSLMETGMSAVIVDNLGMMDALKRAWELVKKNLGAMALISILMYLLSLVVGMVISVPMMVPMFGFIANMGAEPDFESFGRIFRNMSLWALAFSPIYAVLQGILWTFMQSAWTLTYMRLTKPQGTSQPATEANA